MTNRPTGASRHVDEREVRRVARLAQLEFADSEVVSMSNDLNAILGYMDKLRELDVSGVEPTTHAVHLQIPLRPDRVVKTLTQDDVLTNAPSTDEAMFEVPRVVEEGR